MIHPGQRTLYKFEILTEGDLSVEDYDKLLVRPSSVRFIKNNNTIVAAQNRIKKREMVANGLSIPDTTDNYEEPSELHQAEEAHPVFQVIAMDDYCKKANGNSNNSYLRKNVDSMLSSEVATTASSSCFYNSMISYSIDELYLDIYHGARRCNAQQWGLSLDSSTNAFSPSSTALEVPYKTYGRNAFQFFGLTFPHVRCAIEMLIESVAAMITSVHVAPFTAPYKPCYKLPTPAAVMKIQQYQIELRSTSVAVLPSISGSARTDIRESSSNVVHKAPSTSDLSGEKKAVRFLTKSAGATRGSDAWTSDRPNKSTSAASLRLLKKELAENPDAYDDAVFGLNESEYLDWYDVIGTNDTDGVITLTPHQRRIIERNRARYYELAHNYLENPYRRLHVKKSHIHGFGLFTKTHFSKHEMIIEYIGEKIRQVVADKREQRYEDEGVGSCYMFRLDKEEIIDATKLGGMARFINHSCQPNAYARVVATDEMFTEKRIIIFAGKDILEGEEVTYDYKFPIEDEKLSCFCGAIGCKGSMN